MTEAVMTAAPAVARTKRREFEVDLWATMLNDVEIGIMRQTQHRAKSQQFTKDMDVIGQVRSGGQRTGVLAHRAGLWKKKGADRRLVLKLFSETMNWRATMDMMIGRSLQLTQGSGGMPVTSFAVNVARQDMMVQLERSAYKLPFFPERFSFFILTDQGPSYYTLRQNLFSIGADYSIYDHRNRKIGLIDGKLMSVGGFWNVSINDDHNHPLLDATLQLFCGMLRFNKTARGHVETLADEMQAGRLKPAIDHYEKDLYLNPRRAR